MNAAKINRNLVRGKAATKGIFSLAALARQVGCSRPAVYFAIEKPSRYPRVHRRIVELIGDYQ
jgi:hypothetical protein